MMQDHGPLRSALRYTSRVKYPDTTSATDVIAVGK